VRPCKNGHPGRKRQLKKEGKKEDLLLLKVIFSRAAHFAAGIVAGIAALTGMNARMANEVRSGSEFTGTMLAFKRSFFLLSLEILDVV
jgi:hypothetical protein